MNSDTIKLKQELRAAGFSDRVIKAAWPHWWDEELSGSPSAKAELRFALARKLGLQPKPLLGERVEFVWKDRARFKNLGAETAADKRVLSSFAMSVGRSLMRGTSRGEGFYKRSADELRRSILASNDTVALPGLLAACWAVGVPVVHLRVFPLAIKAMHAMVIGDTGTGAIMLGRDAGYPAMVAFTLAHEIAHLALGHVEPGNALVDVEDPATAAEDDVEEAQADAYALLLLTGSPAPAITTSVDGYNAPTLADAAMRVGRQHRIDPATLALCVGYQNHNWAVVMSAIKLMYGGRRELWRGINAQALTEINWDNLGDDEQDFLTILMNEVDE